MHYEGPKMPRFVSDNSANTEQMLPLKSTHYLAPRTAKYQPSLSHTLP